MPRRPSRRAEKGIGMVKKVLYGWKYKILDEKIKWCLSLSLAERYEQTISLADFLKTVRRKEDFSSARRSFKTIQILEKK